jgi:hypothetical protein
MPLEPRPLVLVGACDGTNWKVEAIAVRDRGYLSAWVRGLPENCDRDNIRVVLGTTWLAIDYVSEEDGDGNRQINAVVPADTAKGEHLLTVACAGVATESLTVKIV